MPILRATYPVISCIEHSLKEDGKPQGVKAIATKSEFTSQDSQHRGRTELNPTNCPLTPKGTLQGMHQCIHTRVCVCVSHIHNENINVIKMLKATFYYVKNAHKVPALIIFKLAAQRHQVPWNGKESPPLSAPKGVQYLQQDSVNIPSPSQGLLTTSTLSPLFYCLCLSPSTQLKGKEAEERRRWKKKGRERGEKGRRGEGGTSIASHKYPLYC